MKLLLVAVAALAAIGLSACNTVSGMGKDVKAAGQGMSNSAEDVKEKM
ncbi:MULTISPECIES: entericidin A/B family lipoprotein [Microvirgula]|uniref:Entericidin, EcnA/B family n=1 Tax=Microvirgula aerodenitrificans TaxID=57480 RepID=A0A2S0PAZ8_9NEIS|nr:MULTISPECIES: entericidin A/B family lipoprotein [Microvirgula]AVY94558.1 entericidin, EcnA/B family [Microvirgula aerodenitrificans]RAS19005.1 putative small secreted protein [Microvirgula sp. AG722]